MKKKTKKQIRNIIAPLLIAAIAYWAGSNQYVSNAIDHIRGEQIAQPQSDSLQILEGKIVRISDGDTMVLEDKDNNRHKIRLNGIDCPEMGQSYGKQASNFVKNKCLRKKATVDLVGKDQYGRILGVLHVEGLNINEELLRNGLAWQYKYNKNNRYQQLEKTAREAKLNIWSKPNPMNPHQWRKENMK